MALDNDEDLLGISIGLEDVILVGWEGPFVDDRSRVTTGRLPMTTVGAGGRSEGECANGVNGLPHGGMARSDGGTWRGDLGLLGGDLLPRVGYEGVGLLLITGGGGRY